MTPPEDASSTWPRWAWNVALVTAVILPTAGLWSAPGTPDVHNWREWIANARVVGHVDGYAANNADYPPGASLALATAAAIGSAIGVTTLTSIKLLTTTFLLATTGLVLAWSRRPGLAVLTQTALVTSAVGLVYLDVLVAPFVLGAVWAASTGAPAVMVLLLIGGSLMKWQPLLVAPFAALHVRAHLRALAPEPRRRQRYALALIAGVLLVGVLLVYGWQFVLALVRAGRHGGLSNNAANLPWVLGWALRWWSPDVYGALWQGEIADITSGPAWLRAALRAGSLAIFTLALLLYARARDSSAAALTRYALAGSLAYFLLYPGAHENHLFLSALLAIALAAVEARWTVAAAILNALAAAHLVAFYGFRGSGVRFAVGIDVTVWLAMLTCGVGAWLLVRLLTPAHESDARAASRARRRTAPTGTGSTDQ